ncbi:ATP-dependent Clp protease proteolytic subunit [compost metagenome]
MEPIGISVDELFTAIGKTPPYLEYIKWKEMENRKIVLNEPIDGFAVDTVIMPILRWNEEDDSAFGDDISKRKPITIYLDSPGGDVFVGLIIAEVIKKSKTPVHIIALSMAASMGSVILVSGHVRYAYKYTNVLIHDGDVGLKGSRNKVKDNMKFFEEKDAQVKDFILSNTKITEEKFEEMTDREWWMTAETALEFGIIDAIL